jgi:hypothetical protein
MALNHAWPTNGVHDSARALAPPALQYIPARSGPNALAAAATILAALAATSAAIQEPERRKMMLAQGLDVASSHEEFVKAFPAEILKWSKVVQAIGLDLKKQRTTQPRRWCDE